MVYKYSGFVSFNYRLKPNSSFYNTFSIIIIQKILRIPPEWDLQSIANQLTYYKSLDLYACSWYHFSACRFAWIFRRLVYSWLSLTFSLLDSLFTPPLLMECSILSFYWIYAIKKAPARCRCFKVVNWFFRTLIQ